MTFSEMLTHYSAVLTLVLSVIFAITVLQVETAPFDVYNDNDFDRYPIVYWRFIRRRPPMYLDDLYMEEIIEVFDTKENPSTYGASMTDEDLDQIIFCDFNQHLDKCKQYWKLRNQYSTTPKTIISSSTETATPTNLPEVTADSSRNPAFDEEEYLYSDEIHEVESNQHENMNDEDYYADEH